ncbi:MAG: hypothetical protein ABIH21_02375 [Patescibacteria group bacterium]
MGLKAELENINKLLSEEKNESDREEGLKEKNEIEKKMGEKKRRFDEINTGMGTEDTTPVVWGRD